jgi:hypothetical protein
LTPSRTFLRVAGTAPTTTAQKPGLEPGSTRTLAFSSPVSPDWRDSLHRRGEGVDLFLGLG